MGNEVINLFLDSNIWLDLYHFSANDLEEFSKLKDAINKKIILYMPTQVVNEINRNRDSKISDAYKKFHDFKIEIPNFCKGYSEYASFVAIYNNIIKIHKDLVKKVTEDIAIRNLPADKIIYEIFQLSNRIADIPDIIEKAELRFKRGNPPGKNNSLGDAIIWETLLEVVPNKQDLFFVSGDKDYKNQFTNEFNSYLKYEWEIMKNSKIFFYPSLVSFFNEHQKDINLMAENEKEALINSLNLSGTFRNTHEIIYSLNSYEYFTDAQVNKLLDIAVWNRQVRAIIRDTDIWLFYRSIIKGRENIIEITEYNKDILQELEVITA
jgi:hypothetical protein